MGTPGTTSPPLTTVIASVCDQGVLLPACRAFSREEHPAKVVQTLCTPHMIAASVLASEETPLRAWFCISIHPLETGRLKIWKE